jgi:hypothetical protein
MAKHTVTKTVIHDGKTVRKGGTIDLTPEQAKPLIAIGHVADPAKKDAKAAE